MSKNRPPKLPGENLPAGMPIDDWKYADEMTNTTDVELLEKHARATLLYAQPLISPESRDLQPEDAVYCAAERLRRRRRWSVKELERIKKRIAQDRERARQSELGVPMRQALGHFQIFQPRTALQAYAFYAALSDGLSPTDAAKRAQEEL